MKHPFWSAGSGFFDTHRQKSFRRSAVFSRLSIVAEFIVAAFLFFAFSAYSATNPAPSPTPCPDKCKCQGGNAASSNAGAKSVDYSLSLGQATYTDQSKTQRSGLTLALNERTIATSIYTRPTITYARNGQKGGTFVGDNGQSGDTALVRQILTDQTLADIQAFGGTTQQGYVIKLYARSQAGAKSGGIYTVSGNPIKTVTVRNPDGTAAGGRLEIFEQDGFNGSTASRTYRWTESRSSSTAVTWTFEHFAGDASQGSAAVVRKITLERTDLGGSYQEYSQMRTEWQARSADGALAVVEKKREKYAYYTGKEAVQTEETLDPDGSAPRTTTWTYYTDSTKPESFGKVQSQRRFDGYWEDITYTGGGSGYLTTKTVSSWLNSPVGVEAQARVVTEVEDDQNGSFSSREEKIVGRVVASESTTQHANQGSVEAITSLQALPNGQNYAITKTISYDAGATEGHTVQIGSGNPALMTTTIYYPQSVPSENDLRGQGVMANDIPRILTILAQALPNTASAGRIKSVTNPDGTVATYTYSTDSQGVLTTTKSEGVGSFNGAVTDGVRTVTKENAFGYVIEEVQSDIVSGLELSRKSADLTQLDSFGRPQKFIYNNNAADYSTERRGCCELEYRRDRDGKETTFIHDDLKRLTHAISGYPGQVQVDEATTYDGLTTTVTRSAGGQSVLVSKITGSFIGEIASEQAPDANGDNQPETTNYSYALLSGGGVQETKTNPDGSTEVTERFADGQIKKVSGSAVADTAYDYGTWTGGKWQKTIRLSDTGGADEWGTTYSDLAGRTIKQEHSPGGDAYSTISTYNSKGQLTKVVDPDGVTTLYDYNTKGEQYRVAVDMNGNGQIDFTKPDQVTDTSSSVINDATLGVCRRVITQTYVKLSNGSTVTVASTTFTAVNGLGQSTQRLGQTSSSVQTFPANGSWTVTQTRPDGVQQADSYANGQLATSTLKTASGQQITQTTFAYDNLGRLITSTDARVGATTFTYYDNAQVKTETSPHNNDVAIYTRDAMGRVTDTQLPDGSHQTQSYTLAGQVEWATGSQTYPTQFVYDEQGRIAELHTFQSGTNAAPQVTKWHYDSATGLLAFKEYADGKGPTYAYTNAGRLHTRTWARKVSGNDLVTTYSYDEAGALKGIDYSDGTPGVTLTQNQLGQFTQASNGVSTTAFGYDASFRLATETQSGVLSRVLSHGYDSIGRLNGLTVLSGTAVEHQVAYGFDTTGRMQTVTRGSGAGAQTFTYAYVSNSLNLISTLTGPVLTATNSYEPNRDVLTAKTNKAGSAVVSSFAYSANALGQRTDVTYSGSAFGANSFNLYGYDALGQVTSARRYSGGTLQAPQNPVSGQQFGYGFDQIGNRNTSTNGSTSSSYSPNALNQYDSVNSISFSYDDDGNLLSDDAQSYQWDAENRLVKVTKGSVEVTNAYDAFSRRVRKTVKTNGSVTADTAFLYDGWNVVAEYSLPVSGSGSPALLAANTWGLDLNTSLQGAGGVGGLLARTVAGSTATTYSFSFDGNGNVSELLDGNGSIAAHYEYGPFGETLTATGAQAQANPWRWSSKYQDDESGLSYYGYRFYAAGMGRWISRDPLEEEGGGNLYTMVDDNPIRCVDVLGLYKLTYDSSFTQEDQKRIQEALDEVEKRAEAVHRDVKRTLRDIGGKKGCCWDKLRKWLTDMKHALGDMKKDFASQKVHINFKEANLGYDYAVTTGSYLIPTSWMPHQLTLSTGLHDFRADMQSLDDTLFHELSHLYGTKDNNNDGAFMNAAYWEYLNSKRPIRDTFPFKGIFDKCDKDPNASLPNDPFAK